MWEIVDHGRTGFSLEGEALTDFVRRSIHALIDAGAKPVVGAGKPDQWKLQVQYGSNKHEVAEAVIDEWLRQERIRRSRGPGCGSGCRGRIWAGSGQASAATRRSASRRERRRRNT